MAGDRGTRLREKSQYLRICVDKPSVVAILSLRSSHQKKNKNPYPSSLAGQPPVVIPGKARQIVKPGHILMPSILALFVVCALHALTLASSLPDHLEVSTLIIETDDGDSHEFRVHEAVRPEDQRTGLMFVEELGEREGMLFDYGSKRYASMWMKNTPISLDMLFIRDDGTVSSIAREALPYSRRVVSSREPVRAVLELNGGTCDALGIDVGDRVIHRIFPVMSGTGDG